MAKTQLCQKVVCAVYDAKSTGCDPGCYLRADGRRHNKWEGKLLLASTRCPPGELPPEQRCESEAATRIAISSHGTRTDGLQPRNFVQCHGHETAPAGLPLDYADARKGVAHTSRY